MSYQSQLKHPIQQHQTVQHEMISPPPLKRKRFRIDPDRPISPPPLRRKTQPPQPKSPTPAEHLDGKTGFKTSDVVNRFEILSWNVDGITHLLPKTQKSITSFFNKSARKQTPETDDEDEDGSAEAPLGNFLRRHDFPQVVCLQEVKISSKDEKTRKAVGKAANGVEEPGYRAWFALPKDKFNATGWGGKVYGVCTLIRDDVPGLMKETRGVEWDLEGRVLVSEFVFGSGAEERTLVVVNGYWPNGTMNVWRDSGSGFVKGTRHDMKRRFHELVLKDVLEWQGKGWEVVLIGDMNIARSPLDGHPDIRLGAEHVHNRRVFNEKFIEGEDGMKGVDSWRWLHGKKPGYSYHGEKAEDWGASCDRVDLGIVSPGLAVVDRGEEGHEEGKAKMEEMRLIGAEIWESVQERGGSDHVPISVVLDLGRFRKVK